VCTVPSYGKACPVMWQVMWAPNCIISGFLEIAYKVQKKAMRLVYCPYRFNLTALTDLIENVVLHRSHTNTVIVACGITVQGSALVSCMKFCVYKSLFTMGFFDYLFTAVCRWSQYGVLALGS